MKKYFVLGITAVATFVALNSWGFVSSHYGSKDTTRPEIEYIYVKNADETAWSKGSVIGPSVSADDGVTGHLVLGADGLPAICITMEAIAVNAFGKCQTYGYHSAVLVDGTTATVAGSAVVASSTAGHIEGGLGAGEVPLGIALDAASTSTTQEVFIQIR